MGPRGLPPVPPGILACRDVAPPVWDAGSAGGSLICFPGEVAVPGDVEFVPFGGNRDSGAIVTTGLTCPQPGAPEAEAGLVERKGTGPPAWKPRYGVLTALTTVRSRLSFSMFHFHAHLGGHGKNSPTAHAK